MIYTILISIISSVITLIAIRFLSSPYKNLLGVSNSNYKSSKFHLPMVRGIGIIFPIILILSDLVIGSIFTFVELIVITTSTLIGFWDDKFNLNYKIKLLLFFFIGSIFSFYTCHNEVVESFNFLRFFLNLFIFIFLILFFNQIDGINGLASTTFLIVLLFLFLTGINLVLYLPIIFSICIYLFINMKGNVGIQGDAGSFFMGSFSSIVIINSLDYIQYGLILFVISPIVFDICSTTIIRLFYGINLSIGHRNNLYQRLVAKFQNHYLVTIIFSFLQIIFCFLLVIMLNKFTLLEIYTWLFIVGVILTILFCCLAYLIQNKKILHD